eukprot:scaffold288190_cov26-Tisochrysis_lutea.AAC.2
MMRATAPKANITPIHVPGGESPNSLPTIARHTPRPNGNATVISEKAMRKRGIDGGKVIRVQPKLAQTNEPTRSQRSSTRGSALAPSWLGADKIDRPTAHTRFRIPAATKSIDRLLYCKAVEVEEKEGDAAPYPHDRRIDRRGRGIAGCQSLQLIDTTAMRRVLRSALVAICHHIVKPARHQHHEQVERSHYPTLHAERVDA